MDVSTSPPTALRSFVDHLRAISPLRQEDVDALFGLTAQVTRVAANSDIVSQGAVSEQAFLVSAGLVGRYLQLNDGQRQITALHIPGDMADFHRVAAPRAGSALQALTDVTIVHLSAKELRAIALASPRISEAFWAYSAIDAAVLARWAVNIARREGRQRMAHFLCEIGLRMESSGQGPRNHFLLELTQTQLGDALGLTAVHVNRVLKALREARLIEIEGRIYRVPDWSRLAAIAQFDPDYLQMMAPTDEAA